MGIFSAVLTGLLLASAQQPTDFGIRMAPDAGTRNQIAKPVTAPLSTRQTAFDLASAADFGKNWGTVTSTRRTARHNRSVGGVPNSFHLKGRAIDIARQSGIRHAQIEAAYREAGYQLIESLDEGDHSHFAFGVTPQASQEGAEPTRWGVVYAPR